MLSNTDHLDSARQSPALWLERLIELGGKHDEFESHLKLRNLSELLECKCYIIFSFKIFELGPHLS